MPVPGVSSAALIDGIEKAIDRIDSRLATYLSDLGISQSVDELRVELCESLRCQGAAPSELFLQLNQERLMEAPSGEIIAGMVLAATEEARDLAASEPIQAFGWLLQAENGLGYGAGLLDAAFHQHHSKTSTEEKSAAAKRANPQVQALKEDVLIFLDQHQPAGGWTKKRAIEAYADQDTQTASSLVQKVSGDDWAGIDVKIKNWLKTDPEFSSSFNARLSTKLTSPP